MKGILRYQYAPFQMPIALKKWQELVFELNPKFEFTSINKPIIEEIIKYAHGVPCRISRTEETDITRGLAAIGPTGSGKTTLFTVLQKYLKIDNVRYNWFGIEKSFNFRIESAKSICGEYAQKGQEVIDTYGSYTFLCIDDMGSEPKDSLYFGNRINVIGSIIEERYVQKKLTHITSNFRLEDLRGIYDDRVYSRLSEMCNFFEYPDRDWRLEK